ncbi:hypothetical protein Hanom_Chr04g00359931 [Helianthus anomalus]
MFSDEVATELIIFTCILNYQKELKYDTTNHLNTLCFNHETKRTPKGIAIYNS